MGLRFVIPLALGLGLPFSAQAENAPWIVLQTEAASLPDGHGVIQVQLLEDQTQNLDPDDLVGNIGEPANPRPRKVRITLDDHSKHAGEHVWEFQAPSVTYPNDPCTVVLGPELEVKRKIITASFDYQYACGSGAATAVTHRFAVEGQRLLLRSLKLYSASRDGIGTTLIDFRKGEMTRSFDRQEDDSPRKPHRTHFTPYQVSVNAKTLLACPFPVKIGKVPNCSDKKLP